MSKDDAIEKWLETEHTFEPWARTAIDHGRKYEDEATEVFKEEFEFWRRSFSDGHLVKKIEFLDAGMVKPCMGDSNFLHCSPDGLIRVTFTEQSGKKPEYILREGKCPYQKHQRACARSCEKQEADQASSAQSSWAKLG